MSSHKHNNPIHRWNRMPVSFAIGILLAGVGVACVTRWSTSTSLSTKLWSLAVSKSSNHLRVLSEEAHSHNHHDHHSVASTVRCPVQPPLLDNGHDWLTAEDSEYRVVGYERLAGAIRIRTETYDDMPLNASSSRFDAFYELENYLRRSFPLFHKTMSFERVNVHGLLFTWKGSNRSLKPILLMAHQDVVPVNPSTLHLWTHPPFDAHMDEDGWIWGRGTTDMKSTLIAILSATERLLMQGFQTERSIVFAFGFDEEIGGERGAQHLAAVVLSRYGPSGIAMIVDEGFTGVDVEFNQSFARVGVAEKGCFTIDISVSVPGGHSSVPPRHTGIGILSRLIVELEDHPAVLGLDARNPLLGYLECAAEHGDMESSMKEMIRNESEWANLVELLRDDRTLAAFMGTTQAVDIFGGGLKYNALPELATTTINYRIDFFESSSFIVQRLTSVLAPLVASFNLTFSVLGSHPNVHTNVVKLDLFNRVIEPAPISPTVGPSFELMGGTIKTLFPDTIIAPSGMIAFTDTQWYWDLSSHIYRFVPASLTQVKNYHTVDERIHLDAHLSTTRFFYKLLQNSVGWLSE